MDDIGAVKVSQKLNIINYDRNNQMHIGNPGMYVVLDKILQECHKVQRAGGNRV